MISPVDREHGPFRLTRNRGIASQVHSDVRIWQMVLKKSSQGTMQDGVVTLNGRAASAHDFCATASAETKWLMVDPAAATFEGEFSSVTTSYAEPVTSEIGT